ncbi:MAG: hypothetical protein IPK72_24790 [Candidatus Eisenbacteria bacterium]|nr:hypothetical protein [Candidatus Eisenbacteria bacterium]
MMKRAGVAMLLVILRAAGLVAGALFGWWRRPLAPSDDTRAFIRINPNTEDAISALATGSRAIASQLGAEGVFWQTGVPDTLTIPSEVGRVIPLLGGGACGIVLPTFAPVWRKRRRRNQGAA